MASKIKAFNFNGCSRLRKIVIDSGVELDLKENEKIDLSDTPITDKNNILKFNTIDSELEGLGTPNTFKDAPDGITADNELLKRKIRLKTAEPMEVQTDPIAIHIEGVHLSQWDKKAVEMMKDSLFWFDTLKDEGKRGYLEQRREELKKYLTTLPARDELNDNVRRLGENVLLVSEKILENCDYFNDLEHVNQTAPTSSKPRSWKTFYEFLTLELFSFDGLLWRIKPNKDIKDNIRADLKPRVGTVLDEAGEFISISVGESTINRFFNTLEATLKKDNSKYLTFPEYNDDWKFSDYYNNDTQLIGSKLTNNLSIGWNAERILTELFNYWKEVYSGYAPPPNS